MFKGCYDVRLKRERKRTSKAWLEMSEHTHGICGVSGFMTGGFGGRFSILVPIWRDFFQEACGGLEVGRLHEECRRD